MKINDENIIPPRIKQIIEHCDELREYYDAKKLHKPLTNADYYNVGKIHAYEDVLDMFEQLGIVENATDEPVIYEKSKITKEDIEAEPDFNIYELFASEVVKAQIKEKYNGQT